MNIKAIQTEYNGFLFRSRLEARWAVFFDALDIEYQYEPEGFDLDGIRYLPDFWLPTRECWIEIKPTIPDLKEPGVREYELCRRLSDQTGKISLLIGGQPWVKEEEYHYLPEYGIAVFTPKMLGGWGNTSDCILPGFSISSSRRINEENFCISGHLYGFIYREYQEHPDWFSEPLPSRGDAAGLIAADKIYCQKKYGKDHDSWHYGLAEDGFVFSTWQIGGWSEVGLNYEHSDPTHKIYPALKAARQARFDR
ncbi:MAG: hypothetical protein KAJ73_00980 [Zetaproteobacteria bacterium]|nr:hypothetical protein [Zetaproteobacteria bacterium]